ncbi:hypothetical protein L596_024950 [Steinernema carpocapsae]|uniref:Pyridoxal 5'-phosphate synthase n=1 Tax=Steinernema carpocapsae TaxID=34508 RepID=A0A4V5ZYP5_STECR|nr:hypothetical protein L596_024950 [Steinernema carpocapsae]
MAQVRPFLLEGNIPHDPVSLFDQWFKEQAILSPNVLFDDGKAVTLTTCVNNKPSSRVLQLKSYENDEFVFCTKPQRPRARI